MRIILYVLFFVLGVGAANIYNINVESLKVDSVNNAKYPVHSTAEKKMMFDYYSTISRKNRPSGLYESSFRHKGTDLKFVYYFDSDSRLIKDFRSSFNSVFGKSDNYITGSAKYKLNASTISYSDVKGAKSMFDDIGEPIIINDDGSIDIFFHLVGDESETIKVNLKNKKIGDDFLLANMTYDSEGVLVSPLIDESIEEDKYALFGIDGDLNRYVKLTLFLLIGVCFGAAIGNVYVWLTFGKKEK